MGFGWMELIVIFGIILLLFGPKRLPELAKNLGSSINMFKEEISKSTEQLEGEVPSDPASKENTSASPTVENPEDQESETERS